MPPVIPYVPQQITVHLGTPSSDAENVTVSFSDYVKNVASSEIYPTWEESALRANILAIVSFALNRVYKELPDEGGWFIHWGDYTTYDNPADYSGPTLLVCPREGNLVPEKVLEEFTLLAELDQVRVYAGDHNPQEF